MTTTPEEFTTIMPGIGVVTESTMPPFRFAIVPGGDVFELPALTSASVPLPLLPVFLAVAGGHVDTDEDKVRVAGTFVAYIQDDHPKLWRALKRYPQPIVAITELIRQWAKHSGVDPQPPAFGR